MRNRLGERRIATFAGSDDDPMTAGQVVEHVWRASTMTVSRLQLAIRSAPLGVALIGAMVVGGCGGPAAMPSTLAAAPTATVAPTTTPSLSPTPLPSPTATPRPTATPVVDARIPDGEIMKPGSYVTHGWPAPDDGLTLRFTVPAGWYGFGDGTIFPDRADGTPLQFINSITTLNSDLCHWAGPKGEVNVGTTVDDLVSALVAQTKYKVSDPVGVSIGGYSGKRVDVVFPAKLFKEKGSSEAPGCDEGVTRLFGDGGIYGQAPDERWQTNILDVDGTRFVIIVQDYPDTSDAARAGTAAIVDSMVIERPRLTQSFTSPLYGISVSYPVD
jgi:hypothetical protein